MQTKPPTRRPRGFSLVELLIVITILGVIASLTVVSLSDVGESAKVTTAQAQAQRIASVFTAGFAAGAPGFTGTSGVSAAMNAVGAGTFGTGTVRNSWFQLAGISAGMDDDKPADQQARHYLAWDDGTLVYNPDGGGSAGSIGSFDEWIAAMNAAMNQFFQQNPGATEPQAQEFHQNWLAANPPPNVGWMIN